MVDRNNNKKIVCFIKHLKSDISFIYKYGGVQKPQTAIPQKQFESELNKYFKANPTPKFKIMYQTLLRSFNAHQHQKIKQILHPNFPQIKNYQKPKLLNKNNPISIYFGQLFFGARLYNETRYNGYFKSNDKQYSQFIDFSKVYPYQSNHSPIKLQEFKILGFKNTYDHQTCFKFSLQIFLSSKMKLVVDQKKKNGNSQQQQEVHQLRMQLNGLAPREKVYEFDKLLLKDIYSFKNYALVMQLLKYSKQNWKICEMDYCFKKMIIPQRKKWFGLF